MKPNIILFFADTLVKSSISGMGGSVKTPHMDRLIESGMLLNRVQPNSPVCSPARYNLLTGKYASRAGFYRDLYPPADAPMIRWNVYLKPGEDSLARRLGSAGYATGLCGKWHLGEPVLEPYSKEDNRKNPDTHIKVKRNYDRCRNWVKETAGYDYVEGLFTNNEMAIPMPSDMTCQHNQHWITQAALNFIDNSRDRPFFLTMTPNLPHHPHVLDTLESGSTLTPAGYLDEIPRVQPSCESILKRVADQGHDESPERESPEWLNRDHAAAVTWLDDGLGAMLDKLDELNIREETLILFTSDHRARGKMTLYQQYVPSVISWPGRITPGTETDALISHVDMAATLLDSAACENDRDLTNGLDGKSFLPLVLTGGETIKWNNEIYTEVTYSRGIFTDDYNYVALRYPKALGAELMDPQKINQEGIEVENTRFAALETFPAYFDQDQLYYFKDDGNNQSNLALQDSHQKIVKRLQGRLTRVLKDLGYDYGELSTHNSTSGISRGRGTNLHYCPDCLHVEIDFPAKGCPVCGNRGNFIRHDALYYDSEERFAQDVDKQIPRMSLLADKILIDFPGHPMTDKWDNYIQFCDIYEDGIYQKRFPFNPGDTPLIEWELSQFTLRVISYSPLYGHYQREITHGKRRMI